MSSRRWTSVTTTIATKDADLRFISQFISSVGKMYSKDTIIKARNLLIEVGFLEIAVKGGDNEKDFADLLVNTFGQSRNWKYLPKKHNSGDHLVMWEGYKLMFENKIGLPILPTVFTLYLAVFKIFSIILQVVDLPLVPVIEIIKELLLNSKNKSRSVIIFFKFFFK